MAVKPRLTSGGLGNKIRRARKDAKLSQSVLAGKIGAHFTSVSDWERNVNAPSARHLLGIARETGKPLAFFTEDGSDDEEEDQVAALNLLDALAEAMQRVEARKEAKV